LAQSIESLPAEARARHYRESAVEAFRLAEAVGDEGLRAAYLNVATGWHTMALDLELALDSEQILDAHCTDLALSRR
jgi:hypothetical protein